jgi:hypothetical protein
LSAVSQSAASPGGRGTLPGDPQSRGSPLHRCFSGERGSMATRGGCPGASGLYFDLPHFCHSTCLEGGAKVQPRPRVLHAVQAFRGRPGSRWTGLRQPSKLRVAGSSPVSRSPRKPSKYPAFKVHREVVDLQAKVVIDDVEGNAGRSGPLARFPAGDLDRASPGGGDRPRRVLRRRAHRTPGPCDPRHARRERRC